MDSGVNDYLIFPSRFNTWGDGFGLTTTGEWLDLFRIVCGIQLNHRVDDVCAVA